MQRKPIWAKALLSCDVTLSSKLKNSVFGPVGMKISSTLCHFVIIAGLNGYLLLTISLMLLVNLRKRPVTCRHCKLVIDLFQ